MLEKTDSVDEKYVGEKDLVEVCEYKLDDKIVITYTATWCNPCKKIKPYLEEYLKNFEKVYKENMKKVDYKQNIHPFIPYFVVNGEGIQTSDPKNLKDFLINNKVIKKLTFDDDF